MSYTVQDLINSALRVLGAQASGETPTTDESADGLQALNWLLGSLSTEKLFVNKIQHMGFPLTAGTVAYTMGPGGTLIGVTVRPVRITGARSVSGAFINPVDVLTPDAFSKRTANATGDSSVLAKAISADNATPSLNVRVFPTPAVSPGILELDFWTPLDQFNALTDELSFPPGYEHTLKFLLAEAIGPEYGRLTPELAALATAAKATLVALNRDILDGVVPQAAQ